jgi:hypothetical protein
MAEEEVTPNSSASVEALQRRLDRIEQEYMRENRWWRGGLIGALVVLAIVILIGAFHHRPPPRDLGAMAIQGPVFLQGRMGYPGYWPPPPPPWAYYGFGPGYGPDGECDRHGWWRPRDREPGGPDGPGADGGGPPPPSSNG